MHTVRTYISLSRCGYCFSGSGEKWTFWEQLFSNFLISLECRKQSCFTVDESGKFSQVKQLFQRPTASE